MDWRKVAKFLFGGLLVIGLLIGGYLFSQTERIVGFGTGKPPDAPADCVVAVKGMCYHTNGSVNTSFYRDCDVPNLPEVIEKIDTVESFNKSTGIATCK